MAGDQDKSQEKDFLDIDLDEAIEGAEEAAADILAAKPRVQEKRGAGILSYDNKKYAVGLNWLIAEADGDTELALARAKNFHADFYCMRQGVASQQGFGNLGMGHRVGQQALASVVADVLVGEWHGVFVADNGWWYVAVHADNISPDGDVLFESEEQAYNHFMAQAENFKWPRAYAPESWNIPETSGEIPLSKIIGEGQGPSLKPVTLDAIFSGKRNKNLAFGTGAAIVLLLAVSLFGQQILPSLVPTQAQLPVPNVQVSDTLQAPPQEPSLEDEAGGDQLRVMELVPPSHFISNCLTGFSRISVPLPGWVLGNLRCVQTVVEGSWERKVGSYEMVEPFLDRFPAEVVKKFTDSSKLQAAYRITDVKSEIDKREMYERNLAVVLITKRFGGMGTLSVNEVTPPAGQELIRTLDSMQQAGFTPIGQSKPEITLLTRDDLPYLSIELITSTPPNMMMKYFDMPGMSMLDITSKMENSVTWMYNAKLILKPDPRLIEANARAKAILNTK